MTPHEQVLRARLERVLSAGRIVTEGQAAQTTKKNSREEMRERERRRRSNEVRDEVDGWPWREREYDSRSVCFFFSLFLVVFVSDDDDVAGVNATTLDLLWLFFVKHPQPNSGTYPIPNACKDAE